MLGSNMASDLSQTQIVSGTKDCGKLNHMSKLANLALLMR